jgi:hypothetical protein
MAPKVTTSAERSKRKAKQPVRSDKGRNNRASVSEAKVTTNDAYRRGGNWEAKKGDMQWSKSSPKPPARVTNANQRVSTGSAKVTSGSRPALPPGKKGGELARSKAPAPKALPGKPTPKALPASVTKGLLGPGGAPPKGLIDPVMKRGQPALSGGGKGGRLNMGGVRGGLLLAAGGAAADYVGRKGGEAIGTGLRNATNAPKEDKRSNRPGGGSKPKKPSRPATDNEKLFRTGGSRENYGLDKAPVAPLPASVRKPNSSSSSSSTPSRGSSTQSRSSSSSSSSSTTSTSGTPAKPGQEWKNFNPGRGTSKTNNPLMKDMIKRMKDREDKEQASKAQQLTDKSRQNSGYSSAEKVDGSKYQDELKKKKGFNFSGS